MSWLPHRWRTQRNAIRNANCRIQWIIKTLNASCASGIFLGACLLECLLTPPHPESCFFNETVCFVVVSGRQLGLVFILKLRRVVPRRGDLQWYINNESCYTVFNKTSLAFHLVLRVWYLEATRFKPSSVTSSQRQWKSVADHQLMVFYLRWKVVGKQDWRVFGKQGIPFLFFPK